MPELQNQTTARSQVVELRQAADSPYKHSVAVPLPPPRPQCHASLRRRSLLRLHLNWLSQSCSVPPMRPGPCLGFYTLGVEADVVCSQAPITKGKHPENLAIGGGRRLGGIVSGRQSKTAERLLNQRRCRDCQRGG